MTMRMRMRVAAKGLTATQAEFPAHPIYGPTVRPLPKVTAWWIWQKLCLRPPVPPPPPDPAVVLLRRLLHLLIEQRRGDFKFYYERLAVGCNVLVRPIDIQNGTVRGDLSKCESDELFLMLFRTKLAIVVTCGPPCEIWSAARRHELESGRGPRVLISIADIWGIIQTTAREFPQLAIGSDLRM